MDALPSRYNPSEVEDRIYRFWQENGLFKAKVDPAKKPFSIAIPPPNITGVLHMGHALNNTIQDTLIRYHKMKGEEALWMPGTDHAGIATQNVVERALAKEGLRRQDLGRDKFIGRVWQWKEQYGSTIIKQLKKLGASCDWQRLRFTMDEGYSQAVNEVFIRLYEKGLIYQGNYIINWCPRCQTALSDEEAPHRDLEGSLYYIKYIFKDNPGESINVATTRPETMLGDTAVAVNPKDKRYKKYIGRILLLPLVNRQIRVIADNSVDIGFGTGAVKVTPAHDPNDYLLGKKHNLEFINLMHPDGRMNEASGRYQDMDRFKAREAILGDLKEQGLLEMVKPHRLSAGHCYRCHTIIEPYLSRQWFVKMRPLAVPAIKAVKKGKVKFYPKRWAKVYLNWMENIQDWCISRQIWWGHRLPVYYCRECQENKSEGQLSVRQAGKVTRSQGRGLKEGIIVSRFKPDKCPVCGSGDIHQDEDVLDTWFSSWLWPFATFGWPFTSSAGCLALTDRNNGIQAAEYEKQAKEELEYFYPTSVLVTAPEIIFFWVARMIMAGFEFIGEAPFKDIYIHGTVRDAEGRKMSKSLGNSIDPLEIIGRYGTDALRFSLIATTAQGQDLYLSQERFEQGRNFANKIWNAARFILMNLEPSLAGAGLEELSKKEKLGIIDRWILSRFYSLLKELDKALDNYCFNEAANLIYGFLWHEFCDWYLEMVKPQIKEPQVQVVMYRVLEESLRVMHPLMPFVTEEIWQKLPHQGTSILACPWPTVQEYLIDPKVENQMAQALGVITTIRNMRLELEIPLQDKIEAEIFVNNRTEQEFLGAVTSQVINLAKLNRLIIGRDYSYPRGNFNTLLKDIHISIPLRGIGDVERYRAGMEARITKVSNEIEVKKGMLSNADFCKRAPAEIVEKERVKLGELNETLNKLNLIKNEL